MAIKALGWFVMLCALAAVVDIASFWRGPWARLQDGQSGPSLFKTDDCDTGLPGLEVPEGQPGQR